MKKIFFTLVAGTVVLLPVEAFAATIPKADGSLGRLLEQLIAITNIIIEIVMGIALVVFLWGIFKYVVSKGVDDKEAARSQIIYGLVGLFVMVSVWGIIQLFTNTFFENGKPINAPQVLPTINNK